MINWFDLMRQAQGGSGLDNLARQFNLSAPQTNAALAALMPAFAMGLQHAATDPAAMGRLFQAMTRGPYAAFFENASQAFTPQARREGEQLLDQLFGSDDVSRRVARQAASFSGVGVDVMQQMLPLIAGIVAGGLSRMAQSQGAAIHSAMQSLQGQAASLPQGQTAAGPWADLWAPWLALVSGAGKTEPQRPDPAGQPFEDMMASFLKPPAAPAAAAEPPPPAPPAPQEKPAPEAQPRSEPSAAADDNPFQAWGEMMEKGHELQKQHLASLQTILEGVWGKGGKP
jgi:hypothetical protein